MDETKTKAHIFTCLVLTWSYFAMNVCYATLLVIESSNTLVGVRVDRIVDRNVVRTFNVLYLIPIEYSIGVMGLKW